MRKKVSSSSSFFGDGSVRVNGNFRPSYLLSSNVCGGGRDQAFGGGYLLSILLEGETDTLLIK